jgi:YrbI family 3-deoxy-D-manno-octulosonate 8-phosphate phosphatase
MVTATQPEVLAVIQARGGSKSIPRKNIRPLAGHPLVAYSVAAALASETVTRIIVSTDDREIAGVAASYGAEIPFLRPVELATDTAPDLPLFQHALAWLWQNERYQPDVVVQLRPTSPLRPPGLIDAGVRLLRDCPETDSVRAVVPAGENPYKMWRMDEAGHLRPLIDAGFAEPYNMPRQQLPAAYWQTGHLDVIRRSTITDKGSLTGEIVLPLLVDRAYCVDIDNEPDWLAAEQVIDERHTPLVLPGRKHRQRDVTSQLAAVSMVVFDFDGVLTDNRVWVSEDGRESVACSRSDGMGLTALRAAGIHVSVLSSEVNGVVSARCQKLGIDCEQGLQDKGAALTRLAAAKRIPLSQVAYIGNDTNDADCLRLAGLPVVVADAHPAVLSGAALVLSSRGGEGAAREIADKILRARRAK